MSYFLLRLLRRFTPRNDKPLSLSLRTSAPVIASVSVAISTLSLRGIAAAISILVIANVCPLSLRGIAAAISLLLFSQIYPFWVK